MKIFSILKVFNHFVGRWMQKQDCVSYPEEPPKVMPRFRGTPLLTVKKSGGVQCNSCLLCVSACPARCIEIEAQPSVEKSPKEILMSGAAPDRFEIDLLKCIFCGYCEEACPVDGIRMSPERQLPMSNGKSAVQGIEFLAYRKSLHGGVLSMDDVSH